jgi:LemA protein
VENRIAYARQYYNDAVLTFNNATGTVPRNMIAAMAGMRRPPTSRPPVPNATPPRSGSSVR